MVPSVCANLKMRKFSRNNLFVLKCALIILTIFPKLSIQISIKNEISETDDDVSTTINNTNSISKSVSNVKRSFSNCLQKQSNEIVRCILKQSILNMNSAIDDNDTWHITDYISVIKNAEWKPVENEAREYKSVFSMFLNKINDLLESRSVQFKIPQKNREPRQYSLSTYEEMGKINFLFFFETKQKYVFNRDFVFDFRFYK